MKIKTRKTVSKHIVKIFGKIIWEIIKWGLWMALEGFSYV